MIPLGVRRVRATLRCSSRFHRRLFQYRQFAAAGDLLTYNTPYFKSESLTKLATRSREKGDANDIEVYLKLDALQPTGSFKDRGVSHLCRTLRDTCGAEALITASGGNAGLAVARAGQVLGMQVRVVVPQTTKKVSIDKIKSYDAIVDICGDNFGEANIAALKIAAENQRIEYVHPYDHPLLWEGHSSLVDEIADSGFGQPGVIVLSVGGGGLLNGVYEGLLRHGWTDTKIIAAETYGADCFAKSLEQGEQVTLPAITSLATTLGASQVSSRSFEIALNGKVRIESQRFTDKQVVSSCARFLDQHRLMVEPSCGAALSVIYENAANINSDGRPVAVVVCGGSGVNQAILNQWKSELGLENEIY